MDDEIRFHIETRMSDLVERGIPLEEASDAPRRSSGMRRSYAPRRCASTAQAAARSSASEWIDELWRDMRTGCARFARAPLPVTAVLCAALGIGVTAAVVSAAYAILLRPLPFANADRLVMIYGENTVRGVATARTSRMATTGRGVTVHARSPVSDLYVEQGHAEWRWRGGAILGSDVTANLFPLLGVSPGAGPEFRTGGREGRAHNVVLLSERLWRARFVGIRQSSGSRSGSTVGAPVLMVSCRRASTFQRVATCGCRSQRDRAGWRRNRQYAGAIGRLRDSVTIEEARADLHRLDARLRGSFPRESRVACRNPAHARGSRGRPSSAAAGVPLAVLLVLLMVCANIANLMLARGAARERELAVRTALGASRARLSRQLMAESLAIALLGGALGVGIAWVGVRLLRFAFPDQVPPFYIDLELDGIAIAFIGGITLVTGLLFGLAPALRGRTRSRSTHCATAHTARRAGCTGRDCVARSSWGRSRSRSCSWSARRCWHGATATLPAAISVSTSATCSRRASHCRPRIIPSRPRPRHSSKSFWAGFARCRA